MILTLAISGYRSIRDARLALGPLNVITGPNGSGKSSLYRALRLLAEVAQGRVTASIAAEGGLASTLWAGPEQFSREMKSREAPVQGGARKKPVALKLGYAAEDYGYAIDLGLPKPDCTTLFGADPEIKVEAAWVGEKLGRSNGVAKRRGPVAQVKDESGAWRVAISTLSPFESMMTHAADPRDALELLLLRERMRGWRFYDHFRSDREAPARSPQVGVYTPVLDSDGRDLASAIQTILEIGDAGALRDTIEDAFAGAEIMVEPSSGYFNLLMRQPGLLRPLGVAELSDGTLRYLLLAAALLTPRPPALMVLNEPETSLHPDLLAPLGRLIVQAARETQIIVVSHAHALVSTLAAAEECRLFPLRKDLGETLIDADPPLWSWPPR